MEKTLAHSRGHYPRVRGAAAVFFVALELSELSDRIPPEHHNELYHWRMHLRLVRNDAMAQLESDRGDQDDEPIHRRIEP